MAIEIDVPIPTLSRLAKLSGPFESFLASRVTATPSCHRWGGSDKIRHATLFFTGTLGLELFFRATFNVSKTKAFLLSAAIATGIGIGREYYDWKISDKDCFSVQDLAANTGGVLASGLVFMILD